MKKSIYIIYPFYMPGTDHSRKDWHACSSLLLKDGSPFFEGVCNATNGCLMYVNTSNYLEYKIFAEGGYETHISQLINHYLRADSSLLDIGANIGIHSLSASRGQGVRIYAFEPIAFIRKKLQKIYY